jgi:3-oxoacyl-[acyl-carrier-protein] synthase II
VAIATGGMGSIQDVVTSSRNLDSSYRKVSPYFVPKILGNMAAGHVSLRHRFRGPLHSVSTACAAGSHAIGDAYNFIRLGYADVMLAGGAESNLDALTIAGFARMKALCPDSPPSQASRPFDSGRNGFVIAEGACVLVLEELSYAQRRGAVILAEVSGYGLSSDAHHSTSPSPQGDGAIRSMRVALADAQLEPDDIGYVNAHATSTPVGDAIEAAAIDTVFDSGSQNNNRPSSSSSSRATPLYVSSTKGATGHLLGAAGALESAFTVLALRDGVVPPTLNLSSPDYTPCSFSHVPLQAIHYINSSDSNSDSDNNSEKYGTSNNRQPLLHALKNSFGFGGTNASLVFSKFIP